ncbi:hypothetical protein EYF80_061133 [Liparis tanakae]|uniref:Uncharacterized protein n=1 Tax=Liparis tanakae TaxID=230148 RepID=A0A4Z2EIT7_9TELE|nr:hypothetical protein EYF80_061133 [Liparis tanakae]
MAGEAGVTRRGTELRAGGLRVGGLRVGAAGVPGKRRRAENDNIDEQPQAPGGLQQSTPSDLKDPPGPSHPTDGGSGLGSDPQTLRPVDPQTLRPVDP